MSAYLEANLKSLSQTALSPYFTGLLHGLEKEGLRVNAQGRIAQTAHPEALGSALTHPMITTDYSEALLEFITPVIKNNRELVQTLQDLHRYSYEYLQDELIWCASMPCFIANEDDIPIAYYGESNVGRLKHIYRRGLQYRYGKMMQTIAGIHFNFSLPEAFWADYQATIRNGDATIDFISSAYFSLIRNFRRNSWLLLYLFGASPALSQSFMGGKPHDLDSMAGGDTLYRPWATSLRMSDLGYSSQAQASLNICFNHLESYTTSLSQAISTPHAEYEKIGVKKAGEYRQLSTNVLQIENEYYSDIRPKRVTESGEKPIHALLSRGVQYVEVRNTDINPFSVAGIDEGQANFMDAFLLTCLFDEPLDISPLECEQLQENIRRTVNTGRQPHLQLLQDGRDVALQTLGEKLLEKVHLSASFLDQVNATQRYSQAVKQQREKLQVPDSTPSAQVIAAIKDSGGSYEQWVFEQSRHLRDEILQQPLSAELKAKLDDQSSTSKAEQKAQEASDHVSFDAYLEAYVKGAY